MSIELAFSVVSLAGTSPVELESYSNKAGEIVSLSHPQSYLISPVFLKEAPITTVFNSNFLK